MFYGKWEKILFMSLNMLFIATLLIELCYLVQAIDTKITWMNLKSITNKRGYTDTPIIPRSTRENK